MLKETLSSQNGSKGFFFYLFVFVLLLIHLKFEFDFWFVEDSNPFVKFVSPDSDFYVDVEKKAYLAKSTWFLLTIILISLRIPVQLVLGIGAVVYGTELLLFFGFGGIAWGSIILGLIVVLEWLYLAKKSSCDGK